MSNYFYGLTSVGFWPYILASWLGMLPGGCLYVYLGAAGKAGFDGRRQAHGTSEYVFFGLALVATLFVTLFITRMARRALPNTDDESKV